MTYIGWRRPPPRKPPAPDRPPAPIAMLAAEFDSTPWLGSSYGEMLPPPGPTPPPQPAPGLVIEPPEWVGREAEILATLPDDRREDEPELTALEKMKLEGGDFEPEPWRPIAPPHEPLLPVKIPEPDWREEERLRVHALREEHALDEELPSARPPAQRRPA